VLPLPAGAPDRDAAVVGAGEHVGGRQAVAAGAGRAVELHAGHGAVAGVYEEAQVLAVLRGCVCGGGMPLLPLALSLCPNGPTPARLLKCYPQAALKGRRGRGSLET